VKSVIFVLLMHAHSGDTSPVGAFENQAADYSCDAVDVAGTWSRKNARYVLTVSN
jgi:hypothetical protein